MACAYSNDLLTDGRIEPGVLTAIYGTEVHAAELVRVNLWEPGYVIHDFLHFNRSRAQVEALRAKRVDAGVKGAASRWHPDREDYAALAAVRCQLTAKRKAVLDEVLSRHDLTGAAWAAKIIRENPGDPMGAVMVADRKWQAERLARADAEEAQWQAEKEAERRFLQPLNPDPISRLAKAS